MHKAKRSGLRLILAFFLCFYCFPFWGSSSVSAQTEAIIADHTVVDQYDDIPQEYIDAVKKMRLNIPGESHSAAYRRGLELLASINSTYAVSVTDSGEPESFHENALRVDSLVWNGSGSWNTATGEAQWYTWHAWDEPSEAPNGNSDLIKNHISYCNETGFDIAAIGFGWCWDMTWQNLPQGSPDPLYNVRWAGSSAGGPDGGSYGLRWGLDDEDTVQTGNHVNMDDYLAATNEYLSIAASCNTTVFFTTGPVDGNAYSENGYQREIKHQYIRDHFNEYYSNAALFDYADILCYNDSGSLFQSEWNGNYYPQIHPDNLGDGSIGHIGETGALRLGKALWWLLARLAGWDGTIPGDINNDGCVNELDFVLLENIVLGLIDVPEYLERSDVNNDGNINVLDITQTEIYAR